MAPEKCSYSAAKIEIMKNAQDKTEKEREIRVRRGKTIDIVLMLLVVLECDRQIALPPRPTGHMVMSFLFLFASPRPSKPLI